MKTAILICAFASLTLNVFANDDVPKPQAFARYEGMMNRSPFAVATAVAPPPQAPNFAKDLYIANAAKLADESVVTLASSVDKNLKEYLSTKASNKSGYGIANIEWSDRVGATKVTITKDGQFATLTFNQALLSQPVANAPMQPQVQPQPQINNPVPGFNPVTSAVPTPVNSVPAIGGAGANQAGLNAIKPAPVPMLPTPPPRIRGVIQRNPNAAAAPTPVADDRAQLQDQ